MLHRLIGYTILITTLRLCWPHSLVLAQDSTRQENPKFIWGSLGGGFGDVGVARRFGLSYQTGHHQLSFRIAGTSEFIVFDTPAESLTDYALLYGRSFDEDRVSVAISAGVAVVTSVRRGRYLYGNFIGGTYEQIENTVIGFPIEAAFVGAVSTVFGVGIEAFGDFNAERSFGGIVFALNFGKLK